MGAMADSMVSAGLFPTVRRIKAFLVAAKDGDAHALVIAGGERGTDRLICLAKRDSGSKWHVAGSRLLTGPLDGTPQLSLVAGSGSYIIASPTAATFTSGSDAVAAPDGVALSSWRTGTRVQARYLDQQVSEVSLVGSC